MKILFRRTNTDRSCLYSKDICEKDCLANSKLREESMDTIKMQYSIRARFGSSSRGRLVTTCLEREIINKSE